ncbi:PH domain-containing protein [Paraflavitalea pollutisoli]|uniref:PH domain-containing protein n=1 Tax=Paraflavitalea pollutisoli TaxID=3034143 RepID=UPI0023EC80A5|nr:PH domain-containing protein [Paraflavitalea sp. H1-2-19X]
MNQLTEHSWSTPQRQAKAGLVIILFKATVSIVKTVWPLILVLLFKENKKGMDIYEIIILALPAIILTRSLVEYFYFRFYIAQEDLIIRKGFIRKQTITIPLGKIQAVHIEQNLIHQLANVAKLKIDTAGTEKTEAEIDAIQVPKAELLKAYLLKEKPQQPAESTVQQPPVDIPAIRLSFGDLLKLGISANHIQAFFIVLAFAITWLQNLEEIFGDRVIRIVKDSSSQVGISIASISFAVAFVLLVSVVVSMIRIFLTYFDFQLAQTEKGFKIKSGLINTRQNLVPFTKVQYISWEANWVRRKIGLYNLEFHQVMSDDASNKKRRVKIPLTQPQYIENLLAHYNSLVAPQSKGAFGIHTSYISRHTLLNGVLPIGLFLTIFLLISWQPWWLLLLLLIPAIALHAYVYQRNFHFYISSEALQVDSGTWGRKTQIVKWCKGQQVTLRQSIYQRAHELATLQLSTAGGTITIPFIPLELARQIQNYALFEVEKSDKPWM